VLLPRQLWRQGYQLPGPLRLVGKLSGWGDAAAAASNPGTLFFITDAVSSRRFLVDTGSSFSLLPFASRQRQRGPVLRAADGRRIPCWGFASVPIKLEGEPYSWSFLRAAVKFPILGIDFLRHFRLLVDAAGNRLLPQQPEHQNVACNVLNATPPAAAARGNPWSAWLQEFPELAGEMTIDKEHSHGVHHSIEMVGRPVTAKFCRLDPARLAAARAEFNSMLKAGIIRRSSSQWASPLHLVKKKDGSWRPCGDFRRLNLITTADKYLLPTWRTSPPGWTGARFSASWTSTRGICRCRWQKRTFRKRH
jgi:hypothetical protein